MAEFKYEIKNSFGILSEKNGYSKEFNLISYNDKEPVYDIRTWHANEDGNKKMTKGITLTRDELQKLKELINSL